MTARAVHFPANGALTDFHIYPDEVIENPSRIVLLKRRCAYNKKVPMLKVVWSAQSPKPLKLQLCHCRFHEIYHRKENPHQHAGPNSRLIAMNVAVFCEQNIVEFSCVYFFVVGLEIMYRYNKFVELFYSSSKKSVVEVDIEVLQNYHLYWVHILFTNLNFRIGKLSIKYFSKICQNAKCMSLTGDASKKDQI